MNKNQISKKLNLVLQKIGLKKGDTIYVSGNLINFSPKIYKIAYLLPEIFFNEILSLIGKEGTIAFPTHTFNLIKSKKIFDPKKTPCITGSFSNYIINNKKFERQIHPYASIGAIGTNAKYICSSNKRRVYGINSPFDKLIKLNSKFLSLGMSINFNCTQVHQIEYLNKVPYRYNKFFSHKIKLSKKTKKINFSMFVLKKKYLNMKRNQNKFIIQNFKKRSIVKQEKFLSSILYCYNLNDFYQITSKLFKKNLYCWIGKKLKS